MTLEEQLASVQKAIQHIEAGGQEYEIEVTTTDGSKSKRKMTRAQLKTLYSREKESDIFYNSSSGFSNKGHSSTRPA